jgi:DMSO/TMAO reductase YedYZ molybdopterin-dependent catalytic subunit
LSLCIGHEPGRNGSRRSCRKQSASHVIVTGAVKEPLTLTLDGLAKMPRTTVTANESGTDIQYQGVLLAEIVKRAGAASGTALRGKALASYLLAEGQDGYRVVFALAEFDPDFNDNPILVADTRDGHPLTDSQGPFRLIVPRDQRTARSVRMLVKLTIVQLPD